MKERISVDRQPKRKPNDLFYQKQKIQPDIYKNPSKERKLIARNSVSMGQFVPSQLEHKKRGSSLQISAGDILIHEGSKSGKNYSCKNKANISSCLSDRNISVVRDTNKLFKYRKFSSNAQIQDQACSGVVLKQKLSNLDGHKYFGPKDGGSKTEKYSIMSWMITIRKFFVKEHKNTNRNTAELRILLSYINKLQSTDLNSLKLLIDKTPLEVEISKEQAVNVIQSFFRGGAGHKAGKKDKGDKDKDHMKVNYSDVINSLMQYQLKNGNSHSQNHKGKQASSEEHEEAAQTARFQQGNQQGNSSQQSRRPKKPSIELLNPSKKSSFNSVVEHKNLSSLNQSESQLYTSKDTSPLFIRSRQSLNPSLSPFHISQSQSTHTLPPSDSQTCFYRKHDHLSKNQQQSSLGMLTLQGKSPRELMESQLFESMQRFGATSTTTTRHRPNISFSLDNIEIDPHPCFQQTVQSLEQILKKIKKIQKNYHSRMAQSQEHPNQQLNLFLQQLINYKISMERTEQGQHYSYFVSWQNMVDFKNHSQKLLLSLLQSAAMRQYFMSIEGVKIENSPFLYRSIKPMLHGHIKMLNIAHNNIDSIQDIGTQLCAGHFQLELLNINHNNLKDITPIINKFINLKQIHANNNNIHYISPCIDEGRGKYLKIIDLAHNCIKKEQDLFALGNIADLQIINLQGNPLVCNQEWKNNWNGAVDLNLIYQISHLYVMSDYGHHKDIAFETSTKYSPQLANSHLPSLNNEAVILPIAPSKPKSKPHLDQKQYQNHRKRSDKQNNRDLLPRQDKSQQPKHKISKIKTFLDGRII